MEIFLAEAVGTALLVLLGDGVVANQLLGKTKGHGTGWVMITTGWGLAVAIAVYSVGRISGAHINPAVTLGLWSIGQLEGSLVGTYLIAQMTGALIGAVLVWLAYLPHWKETPDAAAKLGVFATGPEIRSAPANLLCEAIGTFVLVFGVLAIGQNAGEMIDGDFDLSSVFSTAINPLLVGFLVWGIGLSLGGPTGYAINPARDLGPRIAHALLPIAGKGSSDWGYAWIPIVGPIAGGVLGALVFQALMA
ncbi:MAG TPA: MIP/aquaporin family protein [Thermoanaerobaculia bacterium]|nr:MIP/aquaporin family protein [Thermoanaerobaculia bacterium]